MNRDEFSKKLIEKYPTENFSVIWYGETAKDISSIKCNTCGRTIIATKYDFLKKTRKSLCSKCNYKRKDTQKNEELIGARLSGKATDIKFFMENRNEIRHNMVQFTCAQCGRINVKEVANFLRQKYDCGFCEGRCEAKDTDYFIAQLEAKYGYGFTLLSEYSNVKTNVRVRCNNCGFIRDVKPNALLISGSCPKCSDKASKGEVKISKYLNEHNINYETQKYFTEWDIGIHYFDFYIPQYNLVIEYHGRQYYEFVEFFHQTEENFNYRKQKDKLKQSTALSNGLNYISINYHLYSNLENILDYIFNSTTIPQGSRGKSLEIETIQDIG